MDILIAPSILAADFSRLGQEIEAVAQAGCDYIHIDVMDGIFVPNISIGQPVIQAIRAVTSLPLDVHLMIEEPDRYIESFAAAGADIICVHAEASRHLHRSLQKIRDCGKQAAVSLNPATPLETISWVLDQVSMVLIMSVNPGFGGQSFIPATLDKIRALKEMLNQRRLTVDIEVDGGITVDNAAQVITAGANILVSGTGIFHRSDYRDTIQRLRMAGTTLIV